MYIKYITIFFLLLGMQSMAQRYPMGIPDGPDTLYEKTEQKPVLTKATYRDIGSSASVKQYAPRPATQQYGTCAAFATGYAARTIIEAEKNGWTDKDYITRNAFAPGFIYKITEPNIANCWGSHTSDLLANIQKYGIPKLGDFPTECPSSYPGKSDFDAASRYKINGFVRLFSDNDDAKVKVQTVKKSIAEGNPVVISMICPYSFEMAGDVWKPTEEPTAPNNRPHGRHAICVVGFDDNQYGGAFEVMNSWGTGWGNQGFTWITYTDFARFVYQGLEVLKFEKAANFTLGGEIRLVGENGEEMPVRYRNGYYQTQSAYPSGTRYRIYSENKEPCFLYVFSSDLTNQIYPIFPATDGVSAALNYTNSEIAIPSEEQNIRMDGTVGTDYLCALYSKEPINIADIKRRILNEKGSFQEKVAKVLGTLSVESEKVVFERGKMRFSTQVTSRPVVAVVMAMGHI